LKVLILAGGYGTRLSEFTDLIPKPLVTIGGKPMIWHIMNLYSSFGYTDFYVALGYKAHLFKEYFSNFYTLNSDITVDLSSGGIEHHKKGGVDWRVTLVDTGDSSMTGGRVLAMKDYIGDEPFMLTYGDGLANVDLRKLEEFHHGHRKLVTVTAVHPTARFGELGLKGSFVETFKEKPQTHAGWVNGGFFVMNPAFLEFIQGPETVLEAEPLERVAEIGELCAWKHEGYWQCMDTKRDRDALDEASRKIPPPWQNFDPS